MTVNAKILLISGTISYFGRALAKLAHASIFANFTENVAEFGFFFIALSLPPILFKKVCKYILDHFEAKYILTVTQLCCSLILFIQLALIENGFLGKIGLCLCIFSHSTLQYIFISSLFTYLPAIISEDERARYLAQSGSWTQVGYLLGVVLFTLTSTAISLRTFLMIDSFAYLFSAFVFATLRGGKVTQYATIDNQSVIKEAPKDYSKLAIHIAGLPAVKKAFLIALPVILLDFFFSVSTTTALSIAKFKLGANGLGIIEILFRFGVIIVGFTYERFFQHLIHTYRSWLTCLGGACCFTLAIIIVPSKSIVLYAVNAFLVGAAYSALILVGRSVFYATQHSSTYSQAIVMINLIESVGQISIMLATAYLISNHILIVALAVLFFTLSVVMTSHVSCNFIAKKKSNVCKTP